MVKPYRAVEMKMLVATLFCEGFMKDGVIRETRYLNIGGLTFIFRN